MIKRAEAHDPRARHELGDPAGEQADRAEHALHFVARAFRYCRKSPNPLGENVYQAETSTAASPRQRATSASPAARRRG